jgi:hypothetical protein
VDNIILSESGLLSSLQVPDNAYLIKYNSSGQLVWATTYGTMLIPTSFLPTFTIDTLDNIYIVGSYQLNDFTVNEFTGFGAGTPPAINMVSYGTLSLIGTNNTVLIKYNSSGVVLFATSINSQVTTENNGYGVITDSQNNVYIIGSYNNSDISINSFVSSPNTPGNPINISLYGTLTFGIGSSSAFIVKYDNLGTVLWATSITGDETITGSSITTDSQNNVYAVAIYNSPLLTLNSFSSLPTVGGVIVTSAYGTITNTLPTTVYNTLIVKYNSSGVI